MAPDLIGMMRTLVASPSISSVDPHLDCGNVGVVEPLALWLGDLGFETELLPVGGRSDKANLVATLGSGTGGLVLAGHADTVPFDAGHWEHDPFTLTEDGGRLHGLGICDMKGFLALVVEAVRELRANALREPLIVVATADEETTMDGARALVAAGRPRARRAIIGEPTGLRPVRAHKGLLMERVRLIGRAGHSSDPSLGNSALEGMHDVITALLVWRAALAERFYAPGLPVRMQVPFPTLNLGRIHGGDAANRICAECTLDLDVRAMPGMDLEELRRELRGVVLASVAGRGLVAEVAPLFPGVEPFDTPASAELVRLVEQLTGHEAGSVAFGTEGPFYARLGIETVILGPGDVAQAHQPDEFLALDRIEPTLSLLRDIVARSCC